MLSEAKHLCLSPLVSLAKSEILRFTQNDKLREVTERSGRVDSHVTPA
jgi:hypothetical protein